MAPDSPVNAPYHHGDLRASALQMGMERLESQEQPDLGLRALARDLGVSATALYRHFPNKDALLDALALEGLTRLGAHQAAAAAQAGGAGIAATMPDEMSRDQRAAAALHAWSLVHGLAMLILDGQVAYDPAMVRKVVLMTDFSAG